MQLLLTAAQRSLSMSEHSAYIKACFLSQRSPVAANNKQKRVESVRFIEIFKIKLVKMKVFVVLAIVCGAFCAIAAVS